MNRALAAVALLAALLLPPTPPEGTNPVTATIASHHPDSDFSSDAYRQHLDDDATRVPPYTPDAAAPQPDPPPAAEQPSDPAAAARHTEAMVLDRAITVLAMLRDGCGTSSRDQHELRQVLDTGYGALRLLAQALDTDHLTLTAAAQRLADGDYLLT